MQAEHLNVKVERITDAIQSGAIESLDRHTLTEFNATLCNASIGMYLNTNYLQVCETVRFHMLRTMMESFEQRSKKAEFWVKTLAIAALFMSGIQIALQCWQMLIPAPPVEIKQPAPVVQLSCPTPATPQACGQATKKKP